MRKKTLIFCNLLVAGVLLTGCTNKENTASFTYDANTTYERYTDASSESKKEYKNLINKEVPVTNTTTYQFYDVLNMLQNYDAQYHNLLTPSIISQYEPVEIAALWNSSIEYSNRDLEDLQHIDTFFSKLLEVEEFDYAKVDIENFRKYTKSYTSLIKQFQEDSKKDISLEKMLEKLKGDEYKPHLENVTKLQSIIDHYLSIQKEAAILETVESIKFPGESALSKKEVKDAKSDVTQVLAGYSGADEYYLLETINMLLQSYSVISETPLSEDLAPLLAGNVVKLDNATAYTNINTVKVEIKEREELLVQIRTYYEALKVADYTKPLLKEKATRIEEEIKLIDTLYGNLNNALKIKENILYDGASTYSTHLKAYKKENSDYLNGAD